MTHQLHGIWCVPLPSDARAGWREEWLIDGHTQRPAVYGSRHAAERGLLTARSRYHYAGAWQVRPLPEGYQLTEDELRHVRLEGVLREASHD